MNTATAEPQAASDPQEPLVQIEVAGTTITILGTAHISRASVDKVKQLLNTEAYDAVAVELCPSRYNAIVNPDSLAKMDLFQVLHEGRATMVTASLVLSAYQQRMADQLGIKPGEEMRMAIELAEKAGLPVLLIDREVGITLKRVYRSVPWWRRLTLVSGLMASVISREKVSEEEIERLKEGDILETTFSQFADQAQELYHPLIDERDRYMAARLQDEATGAAYRSVLVVVGAGHLKGIKSYLSEGLDATKNLIAELDRIPSAGMGMKLFPWLIVMLILAGFMIGFSRSSDLGMQLILDWVVINGSLSALGALLAGAHLLTVGAAFIAAPLTSLNPTVGAGMVTAAVEVYLRKPKVGDFSNLRKDTSHLKGWWRNRVARTLLVFVFSTLGSVAGTYLAGFRIFDKLTGG
ncbi:MAG: TraB/GumN family protein [Pseudomonadota bacterium]